MRLLTAPSALASVGAGGEQRPAKPSSSEKWCEGQEKMFQGVLGSLTRAEMLAFLPTLGLLPCAIPSLFFLFSGCRYNTARRAAGCERLAEQPAAAGFIAAPRILLSTPGIHFSGLLHGEVRSKRGFTASLQLSLGAGVVFPFWPLSEAAELWAILLFVVTPAGAGLWLPTPGALRPRGVQIHHAISLFNYFYSSLCKSNYPLRYIMALQLG